MYNREDAAGRARAEKGIAQLMAKVVELGGAITGEHGVGLAKSPFLPLQHSEVELGLMRRIKNVFDPKWEFRNGEHIVPDAPGLGVKIDPQAWSDHEKHEWAVEA